jgi:hypothetical protein
MDTHITSIKPPRLIEDVTPAWLSAALATSHPGVEVTTAKVDGVFGYKPNKTRIHLTYNAAGQAAGLPETMILKATFPGLGPEGGGLDFATAAEVQAYQEIIPTLHVDTPKTFYSLLDWEGGNAVILMEDLQRRDFTPLNAFTPLNYGQAVAFIDAIAAIHATHWESKAFETGGAWGPDTAVGQCTPRLYDKFLNVVVAPDWWNKFLREPRAAALPRKLTEQARIQKAWFKLLEILAGSARVIVHGDEHLGNLYLNAQGGPGFLDFFSRPERWPLHYAYFISNALDGLDRRAWERPLLARYLRTLAAHGVTAPSFEEAWYAYRCALLFPLIVWYTNPAKWQPESINTINAARAGLAMLDHGTLDLLGV